MSDGNMIIGYPPPTPASLGAQTANTGLMGPTSGGAAAPTFRTLVTADLPTSAAITQTDTRATAQTGAVASLATFTVGASDSSFRVSGNVLVTTATAHSFSMTCTYTDESSTSRVLTLNFSQLTGAFVTLITNVTGAGTYEGVPVQIRCKAATTITLATTGTFTTVTYNAEGTIVQVA